MARLTSLQAKASTKKLAIGFIDSATILWSICTKHTIRMAKKLRPFGPIRTNVTCFGNKKRVKTIHDELYIDDVDEGEHGLWQRSIMLGDKCQPLDFSGVICYDSNGKKLDEIPIKSPRASPLPMAAKRGNEF